MTSATPSLFVRTERDSLAPRPLVEFLLVGGATLFLLPIAWILQLVAGLDDAELAVGFLCFHAAYVINDPHFSVTYLLFYRNAGQRAFGSEFSHSQRLRYWLAGLVVPIVLITWAGVSIARQSAYSLGLMMQLMFFLVGWHYVKQGFGVLSVLSARRGTRFTRSERRWLLGHCFAGWLYARASPVDPGTEYMEHGVIFTSLPHPKGLEAFTFALFCFSTLGLVWALVGHFRRERRLPPVAALCGFLITVWLWVVYSSIDPLLVYMIPALHSVQYLYFVWMLKRNEAKSQEGPPLFKGPVATRLGWLAVSSIALAWLLFHGAPWFFDEVVRGSRNTSFGDLGPTPFLAAFVTFVNLHHYFMDSVIWRRDNPETRYLAM